MKIICAEYNDKSQMTVSVVGDNALLRNNEDFYIPDFAGSVSCVPQLVVKLNKLGKGISEQFAGRYYEEIGVCVRFYADGMEEALKQQGLPYGVASSFDYSVAMSEQKRWDGAISYRMELNGSELFASKIADLPVSVDKLIAKASDYYMIKIGDFLCCGNTFRYRGLKQNDRIRMFVNEECLMDFYIK